MASVWPGSVIGSVPLGVACPPCGGQVSAVDQGLVIQNPSAAPAWSPSRQSAAIQFFFPF